MEYLHGKVGLLIKENLRIIILRALGLIYGRMEENI